MVKKGCTKCLKCGKMVSKKGMSSHKCGTLKPTDFIVCMICKTKLRGSSFKAHVPSCESRTLFQKHRSFFRFIRVLVREYNRGIDRKILKERKTRCFNKIYTLFEKEKDYLKENGKDLVELEMDNERRRKDVEALKEATKEGIVISKSLPLPIIKEVFKDTQPKISARQVIIKYLTDNGKYNKFMKYLVDHCLKKGDYPTDEELAADNKLFTHLQRTRVYSGYKETVAPFYDMLHLHFNKEEAYLCPFCDKYILRTRKHVYNCGAFKAQYDEDRDSAIFAFIKNFYPQYFNEKNDIDYYIDYYRQYPCSYFLHSIDMHITNKVAFRDAIFKGKQQVLAPANLGTTKDLINEVNNWKPDITLIKRSFESEEPVYSPLISEKEDNEEEEEEEDVINTDKPIEEKNKATAQWFFKFKKQPLPKDYKSESENEEEDTPSLKEEKKHMKIYFKDLNSHFDPKKEPKDDGEYSDLLDLDKL